jgi:hypothetical protein
MSSISPLKVKGVSLGRGLRSESFSRRIETERPVTSEVKIAPGINVSTTKARRPSCIEPRRPRVHRRYGENVGNRVGKLVRATNRGRAGLIRRLRMPSRVPQS